MTIEKIRRVVNECDPVDLLSHAPIDEYEDEIQEIHNEINKHSFDVSYESVSEIVTRVFTVAFGSDVVSADACNKIAISLTE